MQVIDRQRIVRVVGKLEPVYVEQIDDGIRQMLKL
jgi:hypothetical protein